jgi:AmmeMemoRadiSam system protein B
MTIRTSYLANQWYPGLAKEIKVLVEKWGDYIEREPKPQGQTLGVVAPHAGWYFSGKLAAKVLARAAKTLKDQPPDLVIVLGGHLGRLDPIVAYNDKAWSTPLGPLPIENSLNKLLTDFNPLIWSGPTQDNTIEILTPLVKFYFPETKLWPLRIPPSNSAIKVGEIVLSLMKTNPKILIVASTDLTHYGQNYGFEPAGSGPKGEEFRRANDRLFIEAALSLNIEAALSLSLNKQAACSAGAVATLLHLAQVKGAQGFEVDYYASSDISPGPQSVGYAGLEFTV